MGIRFGLRRMYDSSRNPKGHQLRIVGKTHKFGKRLGLASSTLVSMAYASVSASDVAKRFACTDTSVNRARRVLAASLVGPLW